MGKLRSRLKDVFPEIGMLSIVLLFSLIIRVYKLSSVPSTVTGDETTYLSDVYMILYGSAHPFGFMGDGSVAGVFYYLVAFSVQVFGIDSAIFGSRFVGVFFSLLCLLPFYLLLKSFTEKITATIITLLFSVNYVFLNFSRISWPNTATLFFGLFLIFFLKRGQETKNYLYYIFSGIFAGILLYGYSYGRVFVVGVFLYLICGYILKINRSFTYSKNLALFTVSCILIIAPFIVSIYSDGGESVLRRPKATYVFSKEKLSQESFQEILSHQLLFTARGFLLLDKKVMSEGAENMRYVPPLTSPVNSVIRLLFIISLIYIVLRKKNISLWWIVIATTFLIQIVTDFPPNFARGFFYIPFIYFCIGLLFHYIFKENKSLVRIPPIYLYGTVAIFTICVVLFDVNTYFQWMGTQELKQAREPSISQNEFLLWQNYQIKLVKKGIHPITNYEWYEVRSSLNR